MGKGKLTVSDIQQVEKVMEMASVMCLFIQNKVQDGSLDDVANAVRDAAELMTKETRNFNNRTRN